MNNPLMGIAQQIKTTTKTSNPLTELVTSPLFTQQQAQAATQGAYGATEQYIAKANTALAAQETTAADTMKRSTEGKEAVNTAAQQVMAKAKLDYQTAQQAANKSASDIALFQQTFGSETYKKTKQALFDQQMANAQDLVNAQKRQDSGGVWDWIAGQFQAELAMGENELTTQMLQTMQQQEMAATQQLAATMEQNMAVAANANADEVARATMFTQQAEAIANRALRGIAFNGEEYKAQLQTLGFSQEVVNASMTRMDALAKANNLTTSQVQAEQQTAMLEQMNLNLDKTKKEMARSELYRENIELAWRDFQTRNGTPPDKIMPFEQAVQEQDQTRLNNPQLVSFMNSRQALIDRDDKAVTWALTQLQAGVQTPEHETIAKAVESMQARELDQREVKWRESKGLSKTQTLTPDQQKEFNASAADLALYDSQGKIRPEMATKYDRMYKEATELANKDLQVANTDGLADLSIVSITARALQLEQKLVAAGADPLISKFVASGKAAGLQLDIPAKADVRSAVESNAESFIASLPDAVLNTPEGMELVSGAARYQAEMYKAYRTSSAVGSRFPQWRQSIIPADKLRNKTSINLEDPGSMELLFREKLIQRRSKALRLQQSSLTNPSPWSVPLANGRPIQQ